MSANFAERSVAGEYTRTILQKNLETLASGPNSGATSVRAHAAESLPMVLANQLVGVSS
jgi:hypothetical protein